MQDQDAPPVEEGETGGGVAVVPESETPAVAPDAINSTAVFTPLQWTIATARPLPVATTVRDLDASVPALLPTIPKPSPSRFPCAKMQLPVFLRSSTIFSSKPRFRKLPAN